MKINNVEVNNKTQAVYAVWVNDGDKSYCYVGSGKLLDRRSGNLSKLRRGVHANKTLQEAYNNVNEANFEVVHAFDNDVDENVVRQYEQDTIDYFSKLDDVIICNKRRASNGATSKAYNKHNRLTKQSVGIIKGMLINGASTDDIVNKFDISRCNVSKIKTGYRWANVEPIM